jgi:hypothetical protein
VPIDKHAPGIRTRVLLLISLALIIAFTTASSLYIIRSQLRRQVLANLEKDLGHSVETFQDLEAGRLAALERENASDGCTAKPEGADDDTRSADHRG